MFGLGVPELALILVIVIVLFGANRLPQLGRSMGDGIASFRDGLKGKDEKTNLDRADEKKEP